MTALTIAGLWIGFVGMVMGAVVFGTKAVRTRRKEGMEFSLKMFFIVLWAAGIYLTLILGETVSPINGHLILWGRFIDWLVTTPLLLLDLGLLAGLRPKLIAGVMAANVFMILAGVLAALETSPINYLWYIIGMGFFLAILISLLTEFSASAARRNFKINLLFTTLRNFLIVLWIGYPIVWIFGPTTLGVLTVGTETLIYAILDLATKLGFGLILISAPQEVLAQATNSTNFQETVQSYMYDRKK
ncbi:MAG: bacteriorhodopsin [Nostocaceae cyanobacterium]|nr:bacteriorhodopsin [Nostocaceae cyanobacterium]